MIYYNILYYSYFQSGLLLGDVKIPEYKVIFNPHSLQCKYKMQMKKQQVNSKRLVVENRFSPPIILMIIFLQSLQEESYENLSGDKTRGSSCHLSGWSCVAESHCVFQEVNSAQLRPILWTNQKSWHLSNAPVMMC